jgi:hypothetical protein
VLRDAIEHVTTLQRMAALPDVPMVAASGYPGFDAATWHALVAPPNLPKDVAAKLHKAVSDTQRCGHPQGADRFPRRRGEQQAEELRAYIKIENSQVGRGGEGFGCDGRLTACIRSFGAHHVSWRALFALKRRFVVRCTRNPEGASSTLGFVL